ncbi:ABC transporter ATP-binding protein [Pseudovibrio axinellae]|nr:ABC transporter ATP-binding protein [Pseudovibrio axinellae]
MSRIWLSLLTVCVNILALALPLALLQVYDRILPNKSWGTAAVIFFAVLIALLLAAFLRMVRSDIFALLSARNDFPLWQRIVSNLIYGGYSPEQAHLAISSVNKAKDVGVGQSRMGLYDTPFAVVFLVLIWYLGGVVVLAPLIVGGGSALIFFYYKNSYRTALRDTAEQDATLRDLEGNMSTLSPQCIFLGRFGAVFNAFSVQKRNSAVALEKVERIASLQQDLLQSGALLTTVLVVGFGATSVLAGNMTTGGLAACTLLGGRASAQLMGIAATLMRQTPAKVASEHIPVGESPALNRSNLPISISLGASQLETNSGEIIVIEESPNQEAFEVLRELVDKLWPEGQGKWDVSENMRYVPARAELQRGSILENLTRFSSGLEPEAFQLSEIFGLDAMVGRLVDGYRTEVGAHGTIPLSDGAVKRAALVQAFVGNAKLIVLERPDISLDSAGIKSLKQRLATLRGSVTVIMTTASPELHAIADRYIPECFDPQSAMVA